MNKKDFYRDIVKPCLRKGDKPYNRLLWNHLSDSLCRDGIITAKQYNNWVYPLNKYFE